MIQAVTNARRGLLVLSREPFEGRNQVRIGADAMVEILDVRGNRVSLGFAAPSDVTIYRTEVLEELPHYRQAENHRKHLERLARLCAEAGYEMVPRTRPVRRAA